MDTVLGIELGSTRIKCAALDGDFNVVSSGEYTWQSRYENGIWTYPIEEAINGLKSALSGVENIKSVKAMGVSAMMHGYLAFDKDWNLLVPFRTWQNAITGEAATELSELFNFTIPQRWSIAHLYQAILNGEEHIKKLAHITTLSGYIHFLLSGENAVGVGDASGMFPIDEDTCWFNEEMIEKFNALIKSKGVEADIRNILPNVKKAGEIAGYVSEKGSELFGNLLPVGIPLCPCEGDGQTGMTATNSVRVGTGNVSAGTSIFTTVVLDKPLSKPNPDVDVIMTPSGKSVALVPAANCTNDMNAWVSVISEVLSLFGCDVSRGELFTKLYKKSLEGDADCSGVTTINYLAGEPLTHIDKGMPMILRKPESNFTLANFIRSQLYSTMATLRLGMDILRDEGIKVDVLYGHGGLFKTPVVGQRYMASAYDTPVTCLENASEGGPYGMALLASYMQYGKDETLEKFLSDRVFRCVKSTTEYPVKEITDGFNRYMESFKKALKAEITAVENM